MIQDHYNVSYDKYEKTLNGRKTTFALTSSNNRAHKQPAQFEYQLNTPGDFAKNFVLFTTADLEIGDSLVIDRVQYTVHGVQKHNFRIGNRHNEAYIHSNGSADFEVPSLMYFMNGDNFLSMTGIQLEPVGA